MISYQLVFYCVWGGGNDKECRRDPGKSGAWFSKVNFFRLCLSNLRNSSVKIDKKVEPPFLKYRSDFLPDKILCSFETVLPL